MPFETDKDQLRFDISYALRSYGYAPPRTHDASERDAYFARVAIHVIEHLSRMWEFARKPPAAPHSTTGSPESPN